MQIMVSDDSAGELCLMCYISIWISFEYHHLSYKSLGFHCILLSHPVQPIAGSSGFGPDEDQFRSK